MLALGRALRQNQLHHAYLFTGTRGTGKTTLARLLAKAIRCEFITPQAPESENTDSLFPMSCNQCSNCKEISLGTSQDVLEIDGASYNGVDAIRDIRESIQYSPTHGTKKIILIDEVHMLSTAAFNALLKTLEEPPSHIHFFFATTEPHKVPNTILSRVVRYDLKRCTPETITQRLIHVLTNEQINFDPTALELIATAADGSMRDALSFLDQALTFSEARLDETSVRDALGLVPTDWVLKSLQSIYERKAKDSIDLVHEAYRQGYDLKLLLEECYRIHFEQLRLALGAIDSTVLPIESANARSVEEMEFIGQIFNYGFEALTRSRQTHITLSLLFTKAAWSSFEDLPLTDAVLPSSSTERSKEELAIIAAERELPPCEPSLDSLLALIRTHSPLLDSCLQRASTVDVNPQLREVHVRFQAKETYAFETYESAKTQAALTELLRAQWGWAPRWVITRDALAPSSLEREQEQIEQHEQKRRDEFYSSPLVQEAKNLFGTKFSQLEERPKSGELSNAR